VKFLLDHDVDARLGRVFRQNGHQCWTAADANLARAADDELSVYADDRGAVMVTHDVDFSQRRARNPIGKHLQLRCEEPDAADLLIRHFDAVIRSLQIAEHVFVKLSVDGCSSSTKWS
jgi:predicted nuclease of predicted toxin-antitoxin system